VVRWTGSDVLDLENSRNANSDRGKKVEALLGAATSKVMLGSGERERGKVLETLGFGSGTFWCMAILALMTIFYGMLFSSEFRN
jgi:hypothetical protein